MHILQPVPLNTYQPRLYVNGFPKSGLHYLEQFVNVLVTPSKAGRYGTSDLGLYRWHGWTNELMPLRQLLWRLTCLPRGEYVKGHCGHVQEIEYVMWYANIGQLFIYRDLRDAAVSQAHHILSDNPQLMHSHKDLYRMLGGFDEVLKAIITGLGPYPGLIARWENYAGWLDVKWVMSIKFEELKAQPEQWASNILNYVLYNATHLLENRIADFILPDETKAELIKRMVDSSKQTHLSVTFRKGECGGWQEAFKPEHIDLWKQNDPNNWVEKLGYNWWASGN